MNTAMTSPINSIAPLMFISHGAPTFALEPGVLGKELTTIGKSLRDLKAILVVSPHWQTQHLEVMTTKEPPTIHDFYGFPKALYDLSYPVQGADIAAQKTITVLQQAGYRVQENATRGLDHGTWVPLMHLLPNSDIPVFQVSMPIDLDPQTAFKLGKTLGPLRQKGIMIIASGSMTHNLHDFRLGLNGNLPYVKPFADWVKQAIQEENLEDLLAYRELAPTAKRAHPSDEHFLPLFIALGARLNEVDLRTIEGGIDYGILSMDSFTWGLTSKAVEPTIK